MSDALAAHLAERRFHGRVIVYGEYQFRHAEGLVMTLPLFLSAGVGPSLLGYIPERDRSAEEVVARGLSIATDVRGNLPLGAGLAGSTALTLTHLSTHFESVADIAPLVDDVDEAVHGFKPSGVDSRAVIAGRDGLYRVDSGYRPCSVDLPEAQLLVLPPKERLRSLASIRDRVAGDTTLVRLAKELSAAVRSAVAMDVEALEKYCSRLVELDVYSRHQRRIIEVARGLGLVAKATGGLYDKAIIVHDRVLRADFSAWLPDLLAAMAQCRMPLEMSEPYSTFAVQPSRKVMIARPNSNIDGW